ncbi:hypothetical protein C8Q78DRAFT_1046206 [Trametes maxima]|nr:hypothetical protein C8Q78DRAFT_1046206 [Trametes maxima]
MWQHRIYTARRQRTKLLGAGKLGNLQVGAKQTRAQDIYVSATLLTGTTVVHLPVTLLDTLRVPVRMPVRATSKHDRPDAQPLLQAPPTRTICVLPALRTPPPNRCWMHIHAQFSCVYFQLLSI